MDKLIDLDKYPLHRLDSDAGQALLRSCMDDIERNGMFTLKGFLRREVIDGILPSMLHKIETESFTHAREHNVYFDDTVEGLATDHPAAIFIGDLHCAVSAGVQERVELAVFVARRKHRDAEVIHRQIAAGVGQVAIATAAFPQRRGATR